MPTSNRICTYCITKDGRCLTHLTSMYVALSKILAPMSIRRVISNYDVHNINPDKAFQDLNISLRLPWDVYLILKILVIPKVLFCSFRGLLLLTLNCPHSLPEKNAPGGKLSDWKAMQLLMGCCLLCAWKQVYYTSAPLRAFWPQIRRTVS